MGNDRDDTRRLKEYKAYKEEIVKSIEVTKNERELSWLKTRLRSVNRRIADVESDIKYG